MKTQALVIQPYDANSDAVFEMIATAAAQVDVTVLRPAHRGTVGEPITHTVLTLLETAAFVVADIGDANVNIMYEVGLAQAHDLPVIFIARSSLSFPHDILAGSRLIIYDLDAPGGLITHLSRAMAAVRDDSEAFKLSTVVAGRKNRQKVFISYSHRDGEYLERLMVHLRPLERDGLIDPWVDTRLRPGDRSKEEIETALSHARVAILLVSADFLASDFIIDNELPPLLRGAAEKGMQIIPLILKPCRYARDSDLRHFQAINSPEKSIITVSEAEREALYDAVAKEIEEALP